MTAPRELDQQDRWDAIYVENLLGMISHPENARLAREYDTHCVANGLKVGTRKNYVHALKLLDEKTHGKAYGGLDKQAIRAFMAEIHTATHGGTPYSVSRNLITFFKWLFEDQPMTVGFWNAWRTRNVLSDKTVVTDVEFNAMLEAANFGAAYAMRNLRDQALLWVLRETGWRRGAAVSLNHESYHFDDKGGVRIQTGRGARHLKVRAYEGYMIRGAPAFKAWVTASPGEGPHPVFVSLADQNRGARIARAEVGRIVTRVKHRAGITRRVTPHDFKHTRATEMARNGFTGSQMNKALWSPGSRMGRIYEHLNFSDIENMVRREAGVDETGTAIARTMTDDEFERRVAKKLKKLLLEE
jgi:site-specific recombinase XerD